MTDVAAPGGVAPDIRVVVADDQALVRSGFRVIIDSEPGLSVVGEASTGDEAVELARALTPDVICMDVQMPGCDGLEATRRIVADRIPSGVLILTTFDRDDYLFAALEAGASGFILKNTSPEKLVEAVQIVARGDALLSPDVTRRVIEGFTTRAAPTTSVAAEELTSREREVLAHLARGMSNSEIASSLFLGEATVKTHVSKILLKLGLRDRVQAVVFAYEHGIVIPGS